MSIDRIAEICRSLPDAKLEPEDRHHKLTVRRKTFAWHVVDHHGDGRVALHVKAGRGENEALVAADPDRFFLPPYLASKGWVGVYLDAPYVGWDEVRELLTDAYRLTAPKRLVAKLP